MPEENRIATTRNTLLVLGEQHESNEALDQLCERFCGVVTRSLADVDVSERGLLYLCGDISALGEDAPRARVIREHSVGFEGRGFQVISAGQVPLLVHGVGVFFPRFFEEEDLFRRIETEHEFQNLTESTKKSNALRTGIYLTDVTREVTEDGAEVLHHRLLRCSSNLTGPTDNFRDTDRMIMGAISDAAREVFEDETSLNHVLAQIYRNTKDTGDRPRERKAKISAHSDKTKDMREDGLIAFCTFYDTSDFEGLERSESDPYDWRYKKNSGLTRLLFKLKSGVEDASLAREFSITLYPNSVFIIPLSTNRLYTHEIRPSMLNVDMIPTRMGYVARSSSAEALFMDEKVYLKDGDALIELAPMTHETLSRLRDSYYKENRTADEIAYGEVHFSMNEGDYKKPIY